MELGSLLATIAACGLMAAMAALGRQPLAFNAATAVTGIRGLLVATLAGWAIAPPTSGPSRWIPGLTYLVAALLDRVDGWLARTRQTETGFGAWFDTQVDALGLLLAPLCGVAMGRLPPWYLAVGAAYFVYRAALWARRRQHQPIGVAPSLAEIRIFAGLNMGFVAVALFPMVPQPPIDIASGIFMAALLGGFVRQWMFDSLKLRGPQPQLYHVFFRGLPALARATLGLAMFWLPSPALGLCGAFAVIGLLPRLSALTLSLGLALHGVSEQAAETVAFVTALLIVVFGPGGLVIVAPEERWLRHHDGATLQSQTLKPT